MDLTFNTKLALEILQAKAATNPLLAAQIEAAIWEAIARTEDPPPTPDPETLPDE